MAKYLVKQIFEGNTLTGYEVKHQTTSKNLPRGGKFIFVEGVDTKYPIVDISLIDGSLSIIEDTKPKDLQTAFDTMDSGIINDGKAVFKSSSRTTMLVSIDDYQLHIMVPEMFVNDGEVTEFVTSSFPTVGTALTISADIKTYYAEILYDLLQKRRSKLATYVATKTGLGL